MLHLESMRDVWRALSTHPRAGKSCVAYRRLIAELYHTPRIIKDRKSVTK